MALIYYSGQFSAFFRFARWWHYITTAVTAVLSVLLLLLLLHHQFCRETRSWHDANCCIPSPTCCAMT